MKDKIIEEMAKDICGKYNNGGCEIDGYVCNLRCDSRIRAEICYEKGYRKIPEGTVVLAKEKYENLQALKDDYVKGYEAGVDEGWDAARTETAEKFAERLLEEAFADFSDDDYDRLCILVDEIAKEIKEGKV